MESSWSVWSKWSKDGVKLFRGLGRSKWKLLNRRARQVLEEEAYYALNDGKGELTLQPCIVYLSKSRIKFTPCVTTAKATCSCPSQKC